MNEVATIVFFEEDGVVKVQAFGLGQGKAGEMADAVLNRGVAAVEAEIAAAAGQQQQSPLRTPQQMNLPLVDGEGNEL